MIVHLKLAIRHIWLPFVDIVYHVFFAFAVSRREVFITETGALLILFLVLIEDSEAIAALKTGLAIEAAADFLDSDFLFLDRVEVVVGDVPLHRSLQLQRRHQFSSSHHLS